MNMYPVKILIIYFFYGSFVACDSACDDFMTCGDCISHAKDNCGWCSAKEHDGRRCQSMSESENRGKWCNENIYNPQPEKEILENNDFNTGENGSKVVQFRPQSMIIKARPGVPISIEMSYKPANDFPLDVYYLMDYSATMVSHAETLRKQGLEIYEKLTKLTNNVRFGIGSFIDKPALPFSNPATNEAYSFRNHVALTYNMTLFTETLREKPSGSNYDPPEGGFDALMQVMVCKDEIGWRENARRIIILSTDEAYHSAGDGKLVGAVRPHDMKCYIKNGSYSMSLNFDYPSVSQINKIVMENKFKIIFVASETKQQDYEGLEEKIQGAKYLPLKINSNLVETIKNEYLELVRNVELTPNLPPYMTLELNPDCSKNNYCKIKHNEPIKIIGTLTIKSCPDTKNKQHDIIKIGPNSLQERLIIKVELGCGCECEKLENGDKNSIMCSQHGTYQCGLCKCDENRYGSTCNCSGSSIEANISDKCKLSKNNTKLCSGRGTCNCGICECDSNFSGKYCEFSNAACYTHEGKLCGGNGICRKGSCECNLGWSGTDCLCPEHKNNCMSLFSTEVCSGNGECVCGKCVCSRKNIADELCSGRFCDDCHEFNARRCHNLEDYVHCNTEESKSVCDEKFHKKNTTVTLVNHAEMNTAKWINEKLCNKLLSNESVLLFKYNFPLSHNDTLDIIIQKELEEPPVADIWVAIWSVIGVVLLIGVLTAIAWKILIDLYDKREYKKLLKEMDNGSSAINPLYTEPITTFSNPAYACQN